MHTVWQKLCELCERIQDAVYAIQHRLPKKERRVIAHSLSPASGLV